MRQNKCRLRFISRPVIKWKYGAPTKEMQCFVYLEGVENFTTDDYKSNETEETTICAQ